jgi:hypothetical protein
MFQNNKNTLTAKIGAGNLLNSTLALEKKPPVLHVSQFFSKKMTLTKKFL